MAFFPQAEAAEPVEVPSVTLISDARNGMVSADKTTIYLKLFSWVGEPENYEVRVRATDWNGASIYQRDTKFSFKGNWSTPIELALNRFGSYNISVALHRAGQAQPVRVERTRLVRVTPVPVLSMDLRRDSWIGVNTHHNPPWQSLAAAGIHWARDYSWGWLGTGEKAPMAGNGVNFAPTMRDATAAGVSILPVMARTFYNAERSGYTGDTKLIADSYERLAKAFPQIEYWELDNEPEYGFTTGKLDIENYRPYIKAAAEGLKRAGNAKVVLAGTAGMQIEDTRQLVKTEGVSLPVRDAFDVVNYHYYTGGLPVETARSNTNETGGSTVGALLDSQRTINRIAHEAGKEAWLTEIGWDVSNGSAVGERLQAVYLPRVYLLSRWAGTDKVFWYFDRDVAGSLEKYSTMGLFDTQWLARPSTAALAALSQQTALTKLAGSIDLGEDRWCIAMRKPNGGFVLAAWTVERNHPLPRELASARAFDMFGNPLTNKVLSPEVAYFHLAALPAAWSAHVQAELVSSSITPVAKGGTTTVQIQAPEGAASWVTLPTGLTSGPWSRQGKLLSSQLRAAPGIEVGSVKVVAGLKGKNWQRQWPVMVEVKPATVVNVGPYVPGQALTAEVKSVTPTTKAVQINLPADIGSIEAATGEISADRAHRFSITPGANARGPIPLTVQLSDGARQTEWLRPRILDVARAGRIQLDGSLQDWPDKHRYDWKYFSTSSPDFKPEAALAWSPEGLNLAVRLSIDPAAPTNAMNFWDWTNFELFVDSGDGSGKGWGPQSHQFYFVPQKTGNDWRLIAGEYKRSSAIEKTTFDDKRLQTAMRIDGGQIVMEAFIPRAALGSAPEVGKTWRAAIAMHGLSRMGLRTHATWPAPKDAGLLQGSENWGTLRFAGP
jgi:hypothetical protein